MNTENLAYGVKQLKDCELTDVIYCNKISHEEINKLCYNLNNKLIDENEIYFDVANAYRFYDKNLYIIIKYQYPIEILKWEI